MSTVIENRQLTEAVFESMIGKHGVSPEAKTSLASRICKLLKDSEKEVDEVNVAPKDCEKKADQGDENAVEQSNGRTVAPAAV